MAIARLGVSQKEFYELTPREFYFAIRGANNMERARHRTQYEVARFLARHIWNSAGRVLKRQYKRAKEVEPFPWDEDEKPKFQTVEQMKSQLVSLANIFTKKKKIKRKS